MTRIVTTTYRYKPPPKRKGRTLAEITGPAVVTIDPKTRLAKKGRRPVRGQAAAKEDSRRPSRGGDQEAAVGQSAHLERASGTISNIPPELGRHSGVTTAAKASTPANDDSPRRSAIVIVHTRKKVQRQREQQQQMARIVTYVPKRQQGAWTKHLRLIGQQPEEPPMRPSPP